MDRQAKILRHVNREGQGLEIGPSYNPIAPKKDGFHVHVIDHGTRDELVAKYRAHGVDTNAIGDVDFVWHGESYVELTGRPKFYDWVIASHIIEHTPDLIGFINHCDAVLKDGGVLSLAVPDKRYCFDRHRPLTGLARLIDSHVQKNTRHTLGTLAEAYLNAVQKGGHVVWANGYPGGYGFVHSSEPAQRLFKQAAEATEYIDTHAWCFVPHSFRLLLNDLHLLGLTELREVDFQPTEGCEFFVTLGRHGSGSGLSRLEMIEEIDRELTEEAVSAARIAATPGATAALMHAGTPPPRPLWKRVARRIMRRR